MRLRPVIFLATIQFSSAALTAEVQSSEGLISRFTSWFSSTPTAVAIPDEVPVPPSVETFKEEIPETSPPVWIFFNRFLATMGKDPQVKITPLEKITTGLYLLKVSILGATPKVEALATLIGRKREIGGSIVDTHVFDAAGNRVLPLPFPEDLLPAMMLFKNALSDHPLYMRIQEGNQYYSFFVEIDDKLVQFPGDKKDDHYGNFNEAAAYSIYDALNLEDLNAMLKAQEYKLSVGTSTVLQQLSHHVAFEQERIKHQIVRDSDMKTSTGD